MNHKTKSLILSRYKREGDNEFKSVDIKLFDNNDPHLNEDAFPKEDLHFENIKKITLKGFDIEVWLEGMDLIINNLEEISIDETENELKITSAN